MFVKKIAIAAISFGLICGVTTVGLGTSKTEAATNGVKFKQSFKYFKVRGKTSLEIFRDFQKRSPIKGVGDHKATFCLFYTSPSPRDLSTSRMPSSA